MGLRSSPLAYTILPSSAGGLGLFQSLLFIMLLKETVELSYYLCPEHKISFDGFVHYDGRRFGVPYWYTGKTCPHCPPSHISGLTFLMQQFSSLSLTAHTDL